MFKKLIQFFMLFLFAMLLNAQSKDSVKVYLLAPIEIKADGSSYNQKVIPVEKDNLSNLLNTNGFNLIRKGTFFAQDIYGDGFKRNDIEVTIDGERYHSACPNRMDAPLTRINPLELSNIQIAKDAANLQSGLGGKINFVRQQPEENLRVKSALSAIAGYSQNADAAVSVEGFNNRFSLRYATGKPYENADSKSFKDIYGYKDNYRYNLGEVELNGKTKDINYGMSFTYTDNVSFPYLQMDEKYNKIINGHFSYKNNKIYFNYTSHLMDNSLRQSPMMMRTDAKNFTLGLVGEFYEVYFRNWKADNQIVTPMTALQNNLIPNTSQVSVSANHQMKISILEINAKAGLIYSKLNNDNLTIYKQIDNDAKTNSIFPLVGLSLGLKQNPTKDLGTGILVEAATDSPTLESQFIAVKKPMGNPSWIGNTNLKTPVKGSIKGYLFFDPLFLELYASNLWNYVELTQEVNTLGKFQTYNNIDAYMLGMNLEVNYKWINVAANYTFAKNKSTQTPLAEIAPLSVRTVLTSPKYFGFDVYLKHTYNDAQTRIDPLLNETATPSWNKFDVGISYNWNYLTFSVDVENITNELYSQHLSYLRNPFASGLKVFESGRIFRFNIMLNRMF